MLLRPVLDISEYNPMINKLSLSLAISAGLGLVGQQAMAAAVNIDLHPGKTPAVATFASELPANTPALSLGAAFNVTIPVPNYPIDNTNPFFVQLALLGGSKFDNVANATIECVGVSSNNPAVTSIVAEKILGSDGQTTLTYQLVPKATSIQLNTTSTAAGQQGCLFSFSGVEGMSGNMVNQSLSAVVQYKDGNITINTPYSAPLIKFAPGATTNFNDQGSNVIVDVSKSSKKFTTAGSIGGASDVSELVAHLGRISYTAISGPLNATGGVYAASAGIGGANLVISGPALAAVAIPTASGDANTGAVFLDVTKNGACALGFASAQTDSAGEVSFALTKSAVVGGFDVCMRVDGAHDIAKGQITAELTGTAAANHRPVLSKDNNTLVNIKKNGESVKVLNIPNPASQDVPYIRINNMNDQTGKVFGTLYNQTDGAVLGTANAELGSLTPYQTLVLDITALTTAFGVDAWAGRAWMQIDAELSNIAVQGLVRTPAGVLSNLSAGSLSETQQADLEDGKDAPATP